MKKTSQLPLFPSPIRHISTQKSYKTLSINEKITFKGNLGIFKNLVYTWFYQKHPLNGYSKELKFKTGIQPFLDHSKLTKKQRIKLTAIHPTSLFNQV